MSGLVNVDFGGILDAGAAAIDRFVTTDKEKMQLGLQDKAMDVSLIRGQQTANIVAAGHRSLFVAGARPFILWVCGGGVLWQFLLHPMLCWVFKLLQGVGKIPLYVMVGAEKMPLTPPALDTEGLITLLLTLLGASGYRTYEKLKGVNTDSLAGRAESVRTVEEKKTPWYKKMWM